MARKSQAAKPKTQKKQESKPTTKKQTAKTSATKPSSSAKSSGRVSRAEQQYQHKKQLYAIVLFAIGIFVTTLSLLDGPAFWGWLHQLLRGLFGPISYGVGPIIIYIAVIITLDRAYIDAFHKVWQMLVLILLLCGVAQLFFGIPEGKNFFETLTKFYTGGVKLQSGGLMAALICWPMLEAFGVTGTAIIHALLIFVFIMLISGSTLIGLFRTMGKPVKQMSESYQRHREHIEEERSRFNIDVALGDEELPMPEHPVSSPNAKFDRALEQFAESPEQLAAAVVVDTSTGEVLKELPAREEKAEPAIPALTEPEAPLDDLINKAIDDMKQTPNVRVDDLYPPKKSAETKPADNKPVQPMNIDADTPLKEEYIFPPVSLLTPSKTIGGRDAGEELRQNAEKLVETLKSFGVQTRIVDISRGPTVTRYELQPSAGVKISKITGLADDIALNLATAGVRIEAPIPNKPAVGIEVPNKRTDIVPIREIIDSKEFRDAKSRLTIALGKDIAGNLTVGDAASMPHLLIAGATGSGKSVCINSIIVSLLYKSSPDEVRFLMIDPKVVELGIYNGIPHLLVPVVTDPRKAAGALSWAVSEMLNRYKAFAEAGVRDLKGYNRAAAQSDNMDPMPQIVIIIDELADLMMAAPNDVEDAICRLAQMARAAGMHLIIATQRPSVDVITGVIKANIPSRIAFSVSSQVDSRTILDSGGAEKLLGRGDMLFHPVGAPKAVRVQGCYVSDSEVEAVVNFIKNPEHPAEYDARILEEIERQAAAEKKKGNSSADEGSSDAVDPLFRDAADLVVEAGQASTSYLQRRLKVGYARAARLIDELEERGIVGPPDGSKPREVLVTRQQWIEISMRNDAPPIE